MVEPGSRGALSPRGGARGASLTQSRGSGAHYPVATASRESLEDKAFVRSCLKPELLWSGSQCPRAASWGARDWPGLAKGRESSGEAALRPGPQTLLGVFGAFPALTLHPPWAGGLWACAEGGRGPQGGRPGGVRELAGQGRGAGRQPRVQGRRGVCGERVGAALGSHYSFHWKTAPF